MKRLLAFTLALLILVAVGMTVPPDALALPSFGADSLLMLATAPLILPPEMTKRLDELKANFAKIGPLEDEIAALKAKDQGYSELAEQVANISIKNAEIVDDLHKRQDEFESQIKANQFGAPSASGELSAAFKSLVTDNSIGENWRGRADFSVKNITDAAASGGALLTPQYVPGVIVPGRQALLVKQLLGGGNTTSTSLIYFREKARVNGAAYQLAQMDLKGESDFTYEEITTAVKTIAHWTYVSRQMLSDVPYLQAMVQGEMVYHAGLQGETELLNGTTSRYPMAWVTRRAPHSTWASWRSSPARPKSDVLRKAMVQVGRSFYSATGHTLNPEDWADIELTKTSEGAYLFVQPQGTTTPRLWGLPVVPTYAQAAGSFLTAAFLMAADYWQREATRVEVSTEDGDNFRRNRATLLVEKRGTTAIKRPSGIVGGTFAAALVSSRLLSALARAYHRYRSRPGGRVE